MHVPSSFKIAREEADVPRKGPKPLSPDKANERSLVAQSGGKRNRGGGGRQEPEKGTKRWEDRKVERKRPSHTVDSRQETFEYRMTMVVPHTWDGMFHHLVWLPGHFCQTKPNQAYDET